jgi:hypothetical protein
LHPSELHTDHNALTACLHHRICNVHHQPRDPPDISLPNAVTYGWLRSEFVWAEYDLDDDSSDDDRALEELVSEDKVPIAECEPGDFIPPDGYRILQKFNPCMESDYGSNCGSVIEWHTPLRPMGPVVFQVIIRNCFKDLDHAESRFANAHDDLTIEELEHELDIVHRQRDHGGKKPTSMASETRIWKH